MKYCTKCGTELTDDTAFCPNCGTASQTANTESGAQNNNQNAPDPKPAPAVETKKTSNALILGIVAIVAAFVPPLNTISPIVSIIGIVFGAKEAKASGEKVGLILSICSLIPTLISAVTTILSLLITLFSTLATGGSILLSLLPFIGVFAELFEGMF